MQRPQTPKEYSNVDSKSVEAILKSRGPTSPVMRPAPAEHVGNPKLSNPKDFMSMPPPSRPLHSQTHSMTLATARRGKRLSLSFPVQSGTGDGNPPKQSPSSSTSKTPEYATFPALVEKSMPSPTDSGSFLTALAAQERKVLELKEELQRAEGDLQKLKRQWAMHEATKKRNETKHMHQLQSLYTGLGGIQSSGEDDNGSSRLIREHERRRVTAAEKKPPRKAFSGRHTRTLSLLSPEKTLYGQHFLRSADSDVPFGASPSNSEVLRSEVAPQMTRTATEYPTDTSMPSQVPYNGPPKDVLLRTGRQMASDLREGLWTFIDDLRQATVGEEGINGIESRTGPVALGSKGGRKQSSKGALNNSRKESPIRQGSTDSNPQAKSRSEAMAENGKSPLIDVSDSFWKEHGLLEDKPSVISKPGRPTINARPKQEQPCPEANDGDESWENWDSLGKKAPSVSTSLSEGAVSPRTDASSPRTSTSSNGVTPRSLEQPLRGKQDEIPWPSLINLSPGHLKRTASTLMHEWERSLTAQTDEVHGLDGSWSRSPSPEKDHKRE
ncbi:MAG: hypothetical protein M1827_000322 [Pycnora praestabilis]|nr:MAG: hypothetical protein M1827_000322 [Pycnora praestabilis]